MLRAQNVGLPTAMAPWVMVVMSVVYAAVSYPVGAAADRGGGPRLLSAGLWALIASDIVLANAVGGVTVFVGAALWGLHMGLTQGLLAALVAASAPADLRGTAFGVFNLVCGDRAARRERACGLAVGRVRSRLHVLRGRGAQPDRVDRACCATAAPRRSFADRSGVNCAEADAVRDVRMKPRCPTKRHHLIGDRPCRTPLPALRVRGIPCTFATRCPYA